MDLGSSFVADEESFHLVEPADRAFDDPAVSADPVAVLGVAATDHGLDSSRPEQAALLVVVVAAVSDHPVGSAAGPAREAGDGRYAVEQRQQLSDVVAVAAGQRPGQRRSVRTVRRWCLEPARPLSTGLGP